MRGSEVVWLRGEVISVGEDRYDRRNALQGTSTPCTRLCCILAQVKRWFWFLLVYLYEWACLFKIFDMSRKYKFKDGDKLYFVSFAVVGWIDLFVRKEYKDVVVKSLQYCIEKKGLELYAWCIMTSHVHLIISSATNALQNIMRDLKRHTSEELHKLLQRHLAESRKEWMMDMMTKAGTENSNNRGFQLWQQNNQPMMLSTEEMMYQRLDYLHNNPVAAGFTDKAEDWLYSSAKDYFYGSKGMLDICFMQPRNITV